MAKVLKASNAAAFDSYVEKNFASADEVWVTVRIFFCQAAIDVWAASGTPDCSTCSGDFLELWQDDGGGASSTVMDIVIDGCGPGPEWFPFNHGGGTPSLDPAAGAWATLEYHWTRSGDAEFYLDGSLLSSGAASDNPVNRIRVGQSSACQLDALSIAHFDDVKVGTTRGGSEIFSDGFESGSLGAWDDAVGEVEVVDEPSCGQFTLGVVRAGGGSGTVTSSPGGINCGGDCSESYDPGTVVTLTATPAAGSTFAGWSGGCSGTGSCVVTMDANHTVTATFEETIQPADNTTCETAREITGTSGHEIADNTTANGFDLATDPLYNDPCWGFGSGGGGPLWWKYRNPFSRPVLLRIHVEPAPVGSIEEANWGVWRGTCGDLNTKRIMDTGGDDGSVSGYTTSGSISLDLQADAIVEPGETVYVEVDGYSGDSAPPIELGAPNRGRFKMRWAVLSVSTANAVGTSAADAAANCGLDGGSFLEPTSQVESTPSSLEFTERDDDVVELAGDLWFTSIFQVDYDPTVLDDFDRPDENPLAAPWTSPFVTGFGGSSAIELLGHEVAGTVAGLCTAGWPATYGDVEVGCDVTAGATGGGSTFRLFVRMAADGSTGYMCRFGGTAEGGGMAISRINPGGSATVLATGGFSAFVGDKIRLRAEGDVITAQILRAGTYTWQAIVAIDANYATGRVAIGVAGTVGHLDNFSVITSNFPSIHPPARVHRWDGATVRTYFLPLSGRWGQVFMESPSSFRFDARILLNTDGDTVYAVTTEDGGPDGDGWPNPSAGRSCTGPTRTEPPTWKPLYPAAFAYDPDTDEFVRLGEMEPRTSNIYGGGDCSSGSVGSVAPALSFDATAHPSMPGRVYVVWSEKGYDGLVCHSVADGVSNYNEHMAVGCFGPAAPFDEFDVGFSSTALPAAVANGCRGNPAFFVPEGHALLANDQGVCQLFRIPPTTQASRGTDVLCEQVEDAGSLTLKQTIDYESPPGSLFPAGLGNAGFADGLALEPDCHTETALDSGIAWGWVRQGDAFPGNHPDWTLLPALGISGVLWRDIDPSAAAGLAATSAAGFRTGVWTVSGAGQTAASFVAQAVAAVSTYTPELLVLDVETEYGYDPSSEWTWHEDVMTALRAALPSQAIAVSMGPLHDDFNYAAYTSRGCEVWPQSYGADPATPIFDPVVVFDRVVANGVDPSLIAPALPAAHYPAEVAELAAAGHSKWSVFTLDDRPRNPASGPSSTPTEPLRTFFVSWRILNVPAETSDRLTSFAYNLAPLLDAPARWFNDNAQANGRDVIVGFGTNTTASAVRRAVHRDRYRESWAFVGNFAQIVVHFDRACSRSWVIDEMPFYDLAAFARMSSGRQIVWDDSTDVVYSVSRGLFAGSYFGSARRGEALAHVQILRKWIACDVGAEVEDLAGRPIVSLSFRAAESSLAAAANDTPSKHFSGISFRAQDSSASPAELSATADVVAGEISFRAEE